jgi:hypothetical protein
LVTKARSQTLQDKLHQLYSTVEGSELEKTKFGKADVLVWSMCARETSATQGRTPLVRHKTQQRPPVGLLVGHQSVLCAQDDDSDLFTFARDTGVEEFQDIPDEASKDWQDEYMDLT